MALHLEILKNLSGYSWAKYATWFYYKSDNLLFDAGEGVSIAMRNKIYAIDKILLSHGHGDHILGLPGFLSSRATSMGDQNKPLTIYYPKGDRNLLKLQRYIIDVSGQLPFSVVWTELMPGDRIALAHNRTMEAFASEHYIGSLTLGYRILEHRTRLKQRYQNLPPHELQAHIQKEGKENVSERYDCILLCYSGDSMPLALDVIEEAEVVLHDCTFLRASDREENTHAALEEVLTIAVKANVSALGLFHFSTRYRRNEIIAAIEQNVESMGLSFPVLYLLPHSFPVWFKEISSEASENGKARKSRENGKTSTLSK